MQFLAAHLHAEPAQLLGRWFGGEIWFGNRDACARKWVEGRGINAVVSLKSDPSFHYAKLNWLEDDDAVKSIALWVVPEDGAVDPHVEARAELTRLATQRARREAEEKGLGEAEAEALLRETVEQALEAQPDLALPAAARPVWNALLKVLLRAHSFLHERLKEGRAVLVHCDTGRFLSLAVVVHYLMTKGQLPLREATARARRVRPSAALLEELRVSLGEFEQEVARRGKGVREAKLKGAIMGTLGFNTRHRDYA